MSRVLEARPQSLLLDILQSPPLVYGTANVRERSTATVSRKHRILRFEADLARVIRATSPVLPSSRSPVIAAAPASGRPARDRRSRRWSDAVQLSRPGSSARPRSAFLFDRRGWRFDRRG